MEIKRIKKLNEVSILYLLISITGLGYYIYATKNSIIGLWVYDSSILNSAGSIAKIINYSKDIFVFVWLFYFICIKQIIINKKVFLGILFAYLIVIYGSVLLFINGNNMMNIFAGIRAYMYIFMIYVLVRYCDIDDEYLNKITKMMKFIVGIQLISIIVSMAICKNIFIPGVGGYRVMGLFTNSGSLGGMTIGIATYFAYMFIEKNNMRRINYCFWNMLLLVLSLASGMRTAFIYVALLLVICIVTIAKVSEKANMLLSLTVILGIIPIAFNFLVSYVQRGELGVSGVGRVLAWNKLFEVSFLQLVFGQGLGVSTNAAVSMGTSLQTVDSMIVNLIMQFGVIGLGVFVYFYSKIILLFFKKIRKNYFMYIFICVFGILGLFLGNMFEIYSWAIPYYFILFLIVKEKSSI